MVGEHIRVRKGGRWYHAIDCGDETVLHLADEPGERPVRVRRSYRPEFVAGAEVVEVVTHRERTFPPNEVIARAFSRIADPVLASMFRDSEAFAKWCATGRIPPGPEESPPAAPAPAGGKARAAPEKAKAKAKVARAPGKKRKARGAARAKGAAPRKAKAAKVSQPRKAKAAKGVGRSKAAKGVARSKVGARKKKAGARAVRRGR